MTTRPAHWLGAALMALGLTAAPAPASAQDTPRDAAAILKEIDAVQMPAVPANREDQAAVRQYIEAAMKARQKRGELIGELAKADPRNERLPDLLPERWMALAPDQLDKELDSVLAAAPTDAVRREALFFKARSAIVQNRARVEAALPAIEAFAKDAPGDDRAGQLLYMASTAIRDDARKTALEDRVLKDYPESRFARAIQGQRRQRDGVGKPFDLEFQDAITGSTISMADLKGKVVVVDFWATWCGPCVAEMPKMKNLYTEYKNKGVEFIGVSLDAPEDEGGLDALKKFVADNEIAWPQYYQGKGWEGDFSASWGINSIPALFVVAPDGTLHSTQARGQLEQMIPELLKKAGAPAGGGE
jgi:thiol-disulfide isomerase/thioredoxin